MQLPEIEVFKQFSVHFTLSLCMHCSVQYHLSENYNTPLFILYFYYTSLNSRVVPVTPILGPK